MISAFLLAAATAFNPYGVCSHVTRTERSPYRLDRTITAMKLAGMGNVRADIDSFTILPDGKNFDFTEYDRVFAALDRAGITLLPIFNGKYGKAPPEDLDEYRAYLTTILTRYRGRFPVVEIWNEANLDGFFTGADPKRYAETLKVASETVKKVDPSVRVAFTGTAGVPLKWIRQVLEAGAGPYFDVMNVHPYTHPRAPEREMDVQLEGLKKLMKEFGLADKPVWLTEIGWPTQDETIRYSSVLLAGLKIARPEQKTWNILMIDCATQGMPDQQIAGQLLDLLPTGSRVEKVNQTVAVERLAGGNYDAVMYPFDESFPGDTIEAVNRFITDGGVFIDVGGMPCFFGRRDGESIRGMQHGGALKHFPFNVGAVWTHGGARYPEKIHVFATPQGLAAGVKQEPTGFPACRFVTPENAGEHEWIPLLSVRMTNGLEAVSSAVIRYKGARKGAAVLCALLAPRGVSGTNTEANQARYTARALGIAFAEGAEAYFTYNLRASERDPFYSEHHFGLMHADFQPKPAYAAYAQFTRKRPPGSVNTDDAWHDAKRVFYYPRWTCPDGKPAGMIWQIGTREFRTVVLKGGPVEFQDLFGRRVLPRSLGNGRYRLPVDGAPIYFHGAKLVELKE